MTPADAIVVCSVRRRLHPPQHRGGRDPRRGPRHVSAACRCRCSSSARTTDSASASPPHRVGSKPRFRTGWASPTTPADGTDLAADPRWSRSEVVRDGPRASRRPGLPSPVDGPASRPRWLGRGDGVPLPERDPWRTRPATRSSGPPPLLVDRGHPERRAKCWRWTTTPRPDVRAERVRRVTEEPGLEERGRDHPPARAHDVPDRGSRARRPGPANIADASPPAFLGGRAARSTTVPSPSAGICGPPSATCSPPSDEVLAFGEDVGIKGGVYGVTRGLLRRAGTAPGVRCAARRDHHPRAGPRARPPSGFVPVAEIQYLAYLHNAIDQLRGEAATQSFFSRGPAPERPRAPHRLVRRPARVRRTLPQRERGGARCWTSRGWWSPPRVRGDDGAALLRTLVAAAQVDGTVGVLLEPTALYRARDLHREHDGAWAARRIGSTATSAVGEAPRPGRRPRSPPGELRQRGAALPSRGRATRASTASRRSGPGSPLASPACRSTRPPASRCGDRSRSWSSTRRGAGAASRRALLAALAEEGPPVAMARVAAHDSFVPLGPAARHVLPSLEGVLDGGPATRRRRPLSGRSCSPDATC